MVRARRGPRSAASAISRWASVLVIRSRSANAWPREPPNSALVARVSSWLMTACPGTRNVRTTRDMASMIPNSPAVSGASNVNSHKRSAHASSPPRTSAISSHVLDDMPPILRRGTDKSVSAAD
nr:hypothetical protein [Mycobacterium gordonae]